MDEPNTVEGDVIAHPTKAPPLPPELLLCIFHHATLVPDIYDNASTLGPIFIQQFHPALRKALITKCALVRVCRQWWHLATPILYASVYIGGAHCVSSLCSTLERSAESKGTVVGTRPLGEYTQRLDIITPDCADDLYSDADCDLMRMVIQYMHHLAIFSMAATAYFANPALPYIVLDGLGWSANSLRVFDWSSPNLQPPISEIECPLDDCSQLRVLNCPDVHWSWETDQVTIPPTVTTLRMRTLVRVPSYYAHKHNLSIPPAIPLPALQELVLDFCGGGGSCRYLPFPSPDFGALFGFLEYMRPRMPSLEVVQLLDEPYIRCFLEKHTKLAECELRQFMEANAMVRLEDKDGVLLADRLKALGDM